MTIAPETETQDELAQRNAELEELEKHIAEQAKRIEDLEGTIEDLKDQIAGLEGEDANAVEIRLDAYRRLLGDLDHLFGIKWLPIAMRFALDEFGELIAATAVD